MHMLFRSSHRNVLAVVYKRHKSRYTVTKTTTESVYTCSGLDREISYSNWASECSYIFNQTPKYLPPSDFNFNLPKRGLPEFAFVGRQVKYIASGQNVSIIFIRSNVGKSSLIKCLLNDEKIGLLEYISATLRNLSLV